MLITQVSMPITESSPTQSVRKYARYRMGNFVNRIPSELLTKKRVVFFFNDEPAE